MPAINWTAKWAKSCRKDARLFIKLNISAAHFAVGFCVPVVTETYFVNKRFIRFSFVNRFHFIQISRITCLQDMLISVIVKASIEKADQVMTLPLTVEAIMVNLKMKN